MKSRNARSTETAAGLNPTKNNLSEPTRRAMIDLLNARLADAIDLQLQTKQAHWNVKGPTFIALHELFDDVYAEVTDYVDLIAERCVQLGGTAEGTIQRVAEKSTLAPYPVEITAGSDHVEAFSSALSAFGTGAREGIDQADKAGDKDTADIFTEISRGTDKWLWFVEAHAQE